MDDTGAVLITLIAVGILGVCFSFLSAHQVWNKYDAPKYIQDLAFGMMALVVGLTFILGAFAIKLFF
jgi:hypothetical protein